MRTPFDILSDYERRSLAHAVQLPARELGPETWRGVGYRIGERRLVSQFGEVVEIAFAGGDGDVVRSSLAVLLPQGFRLQAG